MSHRLHRGLGCHLNSREPPGFLPGPAFQKDHGKPAGREAAGLVAVAWGMLSLKSLWPAAPISIKEELGQQLDTSAMNEDQAARRRQLWTPEKTFAGSQ